MAEKFIKKAKARLGRSTVGKTVANLVGPEASPQKWVFVIGCYNSGTTLLSTILSKHPEIASLPTEGAFLTDGMKTPEACGWVRMWHKCLAEIEQDENTAADLATRIKRQWGFWYDGRKPLFLEKSISNAARIKFLEKHFQPAYFIYIVRNGYAVAEGIRRKSDLKKWATPVSGDKYPLELCAEQWLESDQYVSTNAANFQHFLTIKYEDLAENTDKVVADVCQFIGIASEPLLDIGQQTLDVTGYNSTVKNMNASSLKRLNAEDVQTIQRVAGKRLAAWGYDAP
jgi:hypothetical protein